MPNDEHLPDFMIIGAMKCATSTLHEQLARLSSVHMSTPKEPNFFSDNENYHQDLKAYYPLFQTNDPAIKLRGESSTHYTKLPTYPETIDRILKAGLTDCKFIYVIRDPIERLKSHYIHEWSLNNITVDINSAIDQHAELQQYSLYHYQINPYLNHFSKENIMVVFYERLTQHPDESFREITDFLNIPGDPHWEHEMGARNQSSQRVRSFPLYKLLIESPMMTWIRRHFVPKSIRNKVRAQFTMQKKPELSPENIERLRKVFDEDLKKLGILFDLELNYSNYKEVASHTTLQWKKTL